MYHASLGLKSLKNHNFNPPVVLVANREKRLQNDSQQRLCSRDNVSNLNHAKKQN